MPTLPIKIVILLLLFALNISACTTRQAEEQKNIADTTTETSLSATNKNHPQESPTRQQNTHNEAKKDSLQKYVEAEIHQGNLSIDELINEKEIRHAVKPESQSQQSIASQAKLNLGQAFKQPSMSDLSIIAMTPAPTYHLPKPTVDRENYQHLDDNPIVQAAEHPVSTFAIDVDTGSYTNVRRLLNEGRLPNQDAVRTEEFINYFDYQYPLPEKNDQPFSVNTEIAPTPWNKDTWLLHIGLKGYQETRQNLPPANLVFLIDVSGSMRSPDKLELLKSSLKLLVNQLRAQDRLTLVVYAGASGVVLNPTPGDQKATILNALDALSAGGSTHGSAGIQLAYRMAEQAFIKEGINRILLCTDGDFNVGTVNLESLIDLVEQKRSTGIALSTFGFGRGNLNDHLAEQLADHGNGQYSYIDTLLEAQKVLVHEMSASLLTIASDVKVQIEFNPSVVAEYRLIGYQNRKLAREDFNNDNIDAGDIGAGHTVTALYEIALTGQPGQYIDPLRYGKAKSNDNNREELAFLKLRYKLPHTDKSRLLTTPIFTKSRFSELSLASSRFKFSASVAAFAQKLRGGNYLKNFRYADIIQLAQQSLDQNKSTQQGHFVDLVALAQSISGELNH